MTGRISSTPPICVRDSLPFSIGWRERRGKRSRDACSRGWPFSLAPSDGERVGVRGRLFPQRWYCPDAPAPNPEERPRVVGFGAWNLELPWSLGFGAWSLAHPSFRPRSAFSLIELLVAVGLMSLIVLGLLVMFQQTQRAFTGSMTQVDMLEGARATTDLIERELEQMTPSHTPYAANFVSELARPGIVFAPEVTFQDLTGTGSPPLRRTNVLHNFFFLTRENQTW